MASAPSCNLFAQKAKGFLHCEELANFLRKKLIALPKVWKAGCPRMMTSTAAWRKTLTTKCQNIVQRTRRRTDSSSSAAQSHMLDCSEPGITDLLGNPLRVRHVLVDDPHQIALKHQSILCPAFLIFGTGWKLMAKLNRKNSKLVLVRILELYIGFTLCASFLSIIPGAKSQQGFGPVQEKRRLVSEFGTSKVGLHHIHGYKLVTKCFFDLPHVVHFVLIVEPPRDHQVSSLRGFRWSRWGSWFSREVRLMLFSWRWWRWWRKRHNLPRR